MQLARDVNDAIADIGRKLAVGDTDFDFFCECGADGCLERMALPMSSYEAHRASAVPLLAEGHPLIRAAEARARALTLKDSSSALRAQAAQQIHRARRTRRLEHG